MGHLARLSTRTTAAAAGALLLAGGVTAPSLAAGPAPQAASSAPAETATAEPAADPCPNESNEYAVQQAAKLLPPPYGPDVPNPPEWAVGQADTSTYNGCAGLSWVNVTIAGATASSPETIMLFGHGRYLGTASATHFGFEPEVERVDDSTLRVTYRYLLDGDANAAPRGRAVSEFHCDAASGRVVHTGEFPPQDA